MSDEIAELAARVCRPAGRPVCGPEWSAAEASPAEVDERPVDGDAVDMRQVLSVAHLRELRAGILNVLCTTPVVDGNVGRQAAVLTVWIAPRLAGLEYVVQDERQRVQQVGRALAEALAKVKRLREERDELARRLRRNEVRVSVEADTPTIAQWAADMAREKAVEELANWCAHVRDSFTSVDELLEQMETRLAQLRGGAASGDVS